MNNDKQKNDDKRVYVSPEVLKRAKELAKQPGGKILMQMIGPAHVNKDQKN